MNIKMWRGRKVDYSGTHPRVWWPDHPLANNGLVRIHRVVMAEKLGRLLLPSEHVHHIDENPNNWTPDNLRLTSASQHAKLHHQRDGLNATCAFCGAQIYVPPVRVKNHDTWFCNSSCSAKSQERTRWPTDGELLEMLWIEPATVIAERLGVSSSAIKKRCNKRGIQTPPRGYWTAK